MSDLPFCECGCGQRVKHEGDRFLHGHNNLKKPWKPKSKPQLCECGCGELTNPGRRFINGHGKRNETYWKTQQEPKLCECGCGELANPGMDYILWHNRRGKEMSISTRKMISEIVNANPYTGDSIVFHHYIYDHSDLSKYTMKVTRAKHAQIHAWVRKAGIVVPHINVKEDN